MNGWITITKVRLENDWNSKANDQQISTLGNSLQKCERQKREHCFLKNVVIQLFENRPNKKGEKTGEQCNSYIQTTIFLWANSITISWHRGMSQNRVQSMNF